MVNIEDFINRLEKILDYYSLSASAFADKINVQRSSLSHLLSGRNKPSLDFILKIVDEFPEVDLYWIIQGKGTFPKQDNVISKEKIEELISNKVEDVKSTLDLFTTIPNKEQEEKVSVQPTPFTAQNHIDDPTQIERIVIFYKNGTFQHYKP